MPKKKSKYRIVNTNPKKEKKQSTLSSYKFLFLGRSCDFAAFKKEVNENITLVFSSSIPHRVNEYYHQLCRETLNTAIKLLKEHNTRRAADALTASDMDALGEYLDMLRNRKNDKTNKKCK